MRPFSYLRLTLAAAVLLGAAGGALAADGAVVASRGDAFIRHDGGSDVWSIGSTALELTLGLNSARTLVPQRLANPVTGREWDLASEPDVTITLGGERVSLGGAGVTFSGASARTTDNGVRLDFTFEHTAQRARIVRSYACYPGSPTIETWTRVEATGSQSIETTSLVGWQLTMPFGHVRWLGGLRGDSANSDESASFYLDDRALEPGERVEIGSDRRSSEDFIPFFVVDGGRDHFYGGVMWSAGWSISFERRDDALRVTSYFPSVITTVRPQQPLEVPHTFFGLTSIAASDEAGALRGFIENGIRQGRPFQPLVTFNSWFPYGTRIDEDTMVAAIDRAASLGVELFVVDAGWWQGAGETNDYDFESGLGTWTEDQDRFPSSLASLADYTHNAGMKFGLWVEATRVALSTVDKPGMAREPWLATHQREYGAQLNAQICLSSEEARQWVLNQLLNLIRRVQPDYIKWDNNFWINCDRAGHGHGTGDGAFAHTKALYGILAELRRQFPDLLIENVAGGGNTLDFGMLGLTDVAWMDDRSAPAVHVRHNLEGLTFAFPPAYLLSFVIDADGEPMAGNPDLSLMVRSRMPGVLGVTYHNDYLHEDTGLELAGQIQSYKLLRDIVGRSTATLLSDQAPVDANNWDVIQELADEGNRAVVFAFKGNPDDGRIVVRPKGLNRGATYDVQSLDAASIGSATGDSLMEDGIEIVHAGTSRAHVLILSAR